jgi:hypothetical protein
MMRRSWIVVVIVCAVFFWTGASCAKWIASDDAPVVASQIQDGAGALSAATGGPVTPWGAVILGVGNIIAAGINLSHSLIRAKRKT